MIGSVYAPAIALSPVGGGELVLLGQSLTIDYLAGANPRFDDFVRFDFLGCHVWKGATDTDGYGKFHLGKGVVLAHRFSYDRTKGLIPNRMQVDHVCRHPACVNPCHLQLVTPQQNLALARIRAGKPSVYGRQDALNDGLAVDLADLLLCEDGSSLAAPEASAWVPPLVRAAWNPTDEGWGDPRFRN